MQTHTPEKKTHTITIAIPSAVSCKNIKNQNYQKRKQETRQRTNPSPQFPVLNTHPFPLAMIHTLSNPLGNTYIANSPRRRFASTNNDSPDISPKNQNEPFDTSASTRVRGRFLRGDEEGDHLRLVRYLWKLCL